MKRIYLWLKRKIYGEPLDLSRYIDPALYARLLEIQREMDEEREIENK